MNVSAWAIRNPVAIILLFLMLAIVGWGAFRGLGADEWPNVDFATIVVNVTQAGASPAELEADVTRKVEDALVGLAHLEHSRSVVTEGFSTTVCEFAVGASSQTALSDVRDAISRIRQTLPADIDEPQVLHPSNSGDPFITYTIASEFRPVTGLSRLVDEDITRALLTVPGVSQVERSGGVKREIAIKLDPSRLVGLGITVDQIATQLRALNVNIPGGRSEMQHAEQGIRALGVVASVDELRALEIGLGHGRTARLGTLGTVTDGVAEVRQIARLDGRPAVGFSVIRAEGATLVETEAGVVKAIDVLRKSLPPDVKLDMVRTMATSPREAVKASLDALMIGSILAVIVVYAFLRSWQSTLIAGLAIPLSVLPTFYVMRMLGYTLNLQTLLGLTLVVGILVDDAIVDLENIHRHIAMGKRPYQAAFDATAEIGLAVIATTFTIIAVFIPVAFMPGIPGLFFRSFGLTVAAAVMFSLVVARTLTPMMAAYLLPPDAHLHHGEREPIYLRPYMRLLVAGMRYRWVTLGVALAAFVGSFALVPMIPKGLFGSTDNGEALFSVQLPTGATLAETDAAMREVTRRLSAQPEVRHVFTTSGGRAQSEAWLGATGNSVATGQGYAILAPHKEREKTLEQFVNAVGPQLSSIPGARVSLSMIGAVGAGKPVSIIMRGTDPGALADVSRRLLADMRGVTALRDVTSSVAEERPELQIRPLVKRAAEQGVSVATMGRIARLASQGDLDFNLPKFYDGDQQVPIRVQLSEAARRDFTAIGDWMVPGRSGLVPLRTVAELRLGQGPVQLNRYDRARQVTFSANLSPGVSLGEAMDGVHALPAMKNLPPSVSQDNLGEAKIMADVFGSFAIAFAFGVFFIYAVLVLLFGGFLQPLTIMGALPLSIGGALAGLLIGGKMLGMMALIGFLMLMGLVTKNAILLVEYAMRLMRGGVDRHSALLAAGRDRVRPILMTTMAMIAGMMPIALEFGEGTSRLSPMAVAVIGGLVTSTLLTLVVVPAAFTVMDDIAGFFRRRIGLDKLVTAARGPAAPHPPEPTLVTSASGEVRP